MKSLTRSVQEKAMVENKRRPTPKKTWEKTVRDDIKKIGCLKMARTKMSACVVAVNWLTLMIRHQYQNLKKNGDE